MLRRMRHKSDFPAISDSVVRIQSMAASETESVDSVTNETLKDVALTNKRIRLVLLYPMQDKVHAAQLGDALIGAVLLPEDASRVRGQCGARALGCLGIQRNSRCAAAQRPSARRARSWWTSSAPMCCA